MAKAQTIENDFVKVPDFTQFQAEFSKWAGDFGKYFVNGKAPSFDFDAVFALQRKNVEAFTAANQLAFDGVKAVAQRQAEIARKAFEEFGKVPKTLLRVEVREAYLHCPKALIRADLWGDSHRVDRASLPSLTEMISDQLSLPKPTTTHEQQVEGLKQTL